MKTHVIKLMVEGFKVEDKAEQFRCVHNSRPLFFHWNLKQSSRGVCRIWLYFKFLDVFGNMKRLEVVGFPVKIVKLGSLSKRQAWGVTLASGRVAAISVFIIFLLIFSSVV